MIPSFHWVGTSSSQILLKRLYSMLTAVSMSALMASAGILAGPAAFPHLRVMMAFLISAFEGLSQLMGSSVSADRMSDDESGAGWFSSSLKCFAHRFSCSLVDVHWFPFLSFTGLSVCWNLPFSFSVTRYMSLRFPCLPAVSACLARSSM